MIANFDEKVFREVRVKSSQLRGIALRPWVCMKCQSMWKRASKGHNPKAEFSAVDLHCCMTHETVGTIYHTGAIWMKFGVPFYCKYEMEYIIMSQDDLHQYDLFYVKLPWFKRKIRDVKLWFNDIHKEGIVWRDETRDSIERTLKEC